MQRTGRRQFLLAAAALAAAPRVRAQAPARLPTLGLLYPNPTVTGDGDARKYKAKWLAALGWNVGKNLLVVHASAEGREDRLAGLAEQLVHKGLDVIWAAGPEAALAAARATRSIPIAFYGVGFPVEQGLVDSLAKPGRNVTGLTTIAGLEWAKCLEALREIVPAARQLSWIRVQTVMRSVSGEVVRTGDHLIDPHAPRLGFEIRRVPVSAPEDLEGAFEAWPFIQAGGLVSYAASRGWMSQHSFTFVDRILRGARPADIPVERPSRFELIVNLRTAKALDLEVPQSLLLRADRVIE
jgi:putative ABC transport system substrate-binding protein